ncbi:site-specific integrase [Sulfurimonas sp. NW15]|uniref:tyrosine-type recombinase/integrase n=1 Tax=Sulfurimonas sp. NW15 TaxID=2922729 RepID=UPI003DA9C2C7
MRLYIRKNIIWLDFVVNSRRYRRSTKLEDTPANRKLVQRDIAPQIQAAIAKGEFDPEKKKIVPTIKEFGYKSLELHRHEREQEVTRAYKLNFEKHILPDFGNRLLSQITPTDLREWQNKIVDKTSASSLKKYRNIFRQIFVDALEEEYIKKNPFDNIKIPKAEYKEITPFSKDEIEKIIKTASVKMRNFFIISIFTGMRTGELIALKWDDIDYDRNEIRIYKTQNRGRAKGHTKTKSSNRTIDMLPIVEDYLKEQYTISNRKYLESKYGDRDDFKFTNHVFLNNKGKPYYSSDVLNLSLKKILKVCDISERTLYNTRHTFASLMLTNNESIMWVSQMLGHKTANITFEKYARFIKEDVKNRAKFIQKWHIFGTQDNPTWLKSQK